MKRCDFCKQIMPKGWRREDNFCSARCAWLNIRDKEATSGT